MITEEDWSRVEVVLGRLPIPVTPECTADEVMLAMRRDKKHVAGNHRLVLLESIGKARYVVHAWRIRALISELAPDLLHALHLTSYGFLAGLSGFQPSIVSV